MKEQDYHSTITANVSPSEAFEKISRVNEWWSTNFEGASSRLGDTFTVRFPIGDYYTIKISELIPDKKFVWDVIDADQTWHEDRGEWKGTKIVWGVSPEKEVSVVTMTHQGLVPTSECYEQCEKGWNYFTLQSLSKLLNEGKGLPA